MNTRKPILMISILSVLWLVAGCATTPSGEAPEPVVERVEPTLDDEPDPSAPSPARAFVAAMQMWDNPELAVDALSHAIEFDPSFTVAYYERAMRLRHLGDLDGAVRDFSMAIETDPGFIQAYLERGFLRLWELGDEGGREDIEVAYHIDPSDLDAALAWAGLIEWDDPEHAREIYDRLAREHPRKPRPFVSRAKFLRDRGDFAGAADDFGRAFEIGMREPWILASRIMALVAARDLELARAEASRAAEQYPDDPDIILVRARLSALAASAERAHRLYAVYLQGDHVDFAAYLEAAYVAASAGDADTAQQMIRMFAQVADDPLRVQLARAGAIALAGETGRAVELIAQVIQEADWYLSSWAMLAGLASTGTAIPADLAERLDQRFQELGQFIRSHAMIEFDLIVWSTLLGVEL